MPETSKLIQANVDQTFRINLKSKQIHVQLNRMLLAFGTSVSLMGDVIERWKEHLLIQQATDQQEALFNLPFLLVPEFVDSITDRLSANGREVALEYKRLIQSLHFSSLLIDMARRSGHQLPADDLPAGTSLTEIYKSAEFIAAQQRRVARSYSTHLTRSYETRSMTFNQQGVHAAVHA